MFSFKGFAVLALAVGASASAAAQAGDRSEMIPRVEIGINYSYMRANAAPGNCGCFSLNGGSTEIAFRAWRNFSAVFDLTGAHAGTTSIPGQSLSLLSYTGGPRFSYPLHRVRHVRMIPFVQSLFGAAHGFDGQFPTHADTLASSATSFALLVGGGLDLEFKRRLAIRVAQVDYELDQLPNNATDSENLLRVSAGVVFRLR
jgi:outer membrane immunogenic protein